MFFYFFIYEKKMSEEYFNLEQKRKEADLSQEEMASFLGISQSQVSRYEREPETIPAGLYIKWKQYCGDLLKVVGLKIEDPRVEINSRLNLINQYADTAIIYDNNDIIESKIDVNKFLGNITSLARKPIVGVFGSFDAGKSTLINVLIGANHLPAGYQPETSVVSILRHINEKPEWQAEDVWIMKKGFDFNKTNDKQHCLDHKLVAGGYESLKQYGTHSGSRKEEKAFAAIVYIDSPILLAADFIDLPGYGNNEDDEGRAEIAHKTVDVLIYVSQVTGFLNQNDLRFLSALLRNLPENYNREKPLENVFIVCTHAHQIQDEERRQQVINKAATRAYNHLESLLKQYSSSIKEDFYNCFYTFSADDKKIREKFEKELAKFLTKTTPQNSLDKIENCIIEAKKNVKNDCDKWISNLEFVLKERENAKKQYEELLANEPKRKKNIDSKRRKIEKSISFYKTESIEFASSKFINLTSITALESMIRKRYDNKKDAQQLAGSYVMDELQNLINKHIKVQSKKLSSEIDTLLEEFSPKIDSVSGLGEGFSFNPQIAFMSALSGFGALGALSAWASIAAAGSNLGGYVLIAQIVGWLSSIGISVGPVSTVMSFVSAIGGPITLGIAAAITVALSFFSLFGDSWQLKLAKKIHENLGTKGVKEKLEDNLSSFWEQTLKVFIFSIESTEREYQKNLELLQNLISSKNKDEIEKEIATIEETKSFFIGIPWKIVN